MCRAYGKVDRFIRICVASSCGLPVATKISIPPDHQWPENLHLGAHIKQSDLQRLRMLGYGKTLGVGHKGGT